jgi:hypothetical protein
LQQATQRLRRLKAVPQPWPTLARAAAASSTTKAAWGWLSRLPTYSETTHYRQAVAAATKTTTHADPDLALIFTGHSTSLDFQAGLSTVTLTLKGHLTDDPHQQLPATNGRIYHNIDKWMRRHGWQPDDAHAYRWTHPTTRHTIDWHDLKRQLCHPDATTTRPRQQQPRKKPPTAEALLREVHHHLREAWRANHYNTWHQGPSYRARSTAATTTYHAERLARTRQTALTSKHHYTIHTGGIVSDARYATMQTPRNVRTTSQQQRLRRRCTMCNQRTGTWLHAAWKCPENPPPFTHNELRNLDVLTTEMGWAPTPTRNADNDHNLHQRILRHLTQTREKILTNRYGPRRQPEQPQHQPQPTTNTQPPQPTTTDASAARRPRQQPTTASQPPQQPGTTPSTTSTTPTTPHPQPLYEAPSQRRPRLPQHDDHFHDAPPRPTQRAHN